MSGYNRGIRDSANFSKQAIRNEAGFEQWYVENAFDYVRDPIGSRDCGMQRKAWHAALDAIAPTLHAYRRFAGLMLDDLFEYGDIDGFQRQEIALKAGMIEPYIITQEEVDAGNNPDDFYAGDEAFKFSALGKAALKP